MTPETPAKGIMKDLDYPDCKAFTFKCACFTHDMEMFIEHEHDTKQITLTLYAKWERPFKWGYFKNLWNAIKGVTKCEADIRFGRQEAVNIANAILTSVESIEAATCKKEEPNAHL